MKGKTNSERLDKSGHLLDTLTFLEGHSVKASIYI